MLFFRQAHSAASQLLNLFTIAGPVYPVTRHFATALSRADFKTAYFRAAYNAGEVGKMTLPAALRERRYARE